MSAGKPVSGLSAEEKRELLARLLAERAARPQSHPLSFAQQRLWFLDRMGPGTDAYNVWTISRIEGPLHLPAFAASLGELTRRHGTLRTSFTLEDGEPLQVVAAAAEPWLRTADLSGLPPEEREREARRVAAEAARAPFDLGRGPLLRVTLLRLDAGQSLAVLVMHHIISDGWSLRILVRELSALYRAFSAGRPSPLPELPLQYADFVRWQRQWLRGEVLETQLSYWKRQLAGAPVLELPADRPRPALQSFRGAGQPFSFSGELREALAALARREEATPFMVLLAALQVLLYRYTGQEDVSVGSPVANRNRKELETLIGFFANTLVLRTRVEPGPSFRELLAKVRETALEAYTHQDLPFEKLVEEVKPRRDLSHSVLFQVAFALQNAPDAGTAWAGSAAALPNVERSTAKFDLTFEVFEGPRGLGGILEYNRDLFDRATIKRLLEHFEGLLRGIAEAPGTPVGLLPLLPEAQRHQMLREWGDTSRPRPEGLCLHRLFEEKARERPDAVAAAFQGETLTYGELDRLANRLANRLRALGIGPEARVGVSMERSLELVVALLGILKAGAAYVPLDATYPAERLEAMAEDAFGGEARPVLILQEPLASRLPAALGERARRVALDTAGREALAGERDDDPEVLVDADGLAYVIFTSGSTGRPKGGMNSHRGIVNRLLWMQEAYCLDGGDRVLQKTPFSFDVSVWEFFWPLLAGARLVLAAPGGHQDPGYLAHLIAAEGVTTLHFVPSMLQVFLEEPGLSSLRSLRRVIASGEALPPAVVERFFARMPPGVELHNLYGPTEAAVDVTAWRCEPDGSSVPIGRPMANTRIHLLDRNGQEIPIGVAGELHIGGAQVGRGYLDRPALTAERFVPDPFSSGARLYRTGDLARWRPDGALEYLGRIDHQVKIRGFRIELGEIEAVLARHPGVREAAVLARDAGSETSLAAYVVPAGGEPVPVPELKAFLRERLPEAMVPAAVLSLSELPLSANGKLDRRALARLGPAPDGAQPTEGPVHVEPSTGLETTIAAAWREVLGVERIGVRDNFFDIGGHSLKLVAVHARLRRSLERDLSIVEMFQHPTIESLARFLAGGSREGEELERARTRAAERGQNAPAGAALSGFAVIGMAGRFPGAGSVEELWENLRQGIESIETFSDEELRAAGVDPERLSSPGYVKAGAALSGTDLFDAEFFGFSPREAEILDPQQRLFLECSWQALESAGYDPRGCRVPVGVYAGAQMSTYMFNLFSHPEILGSMGVLAVQSGVDKDFLATRVSYGLDLKGPSLAVQTACSTSLVAVHLACRALHLRDCDMALAGGVTVRVPQRIGYTYQEAGILSPDGHCRAFDARARGTVFGSGVGVVVLKRLPDALRDGDTIHAVVKGTALNNDGSHKVGYTAPSVFGQAQVIAAAQAEAGVSPDTITYVEAHGTGTPLGDPIEVAALTRAFRLGTARTGFCALGSVKSNLGHLDAAAGIAGFIKTVLMLRHRQIPPSLHFEEPNPKIDFASSPFHVAKELSPWQADGSPLRAGVSSFGIGGTNAHAVLEEAPPAEPSGPSRSRQLLLLSARSPAGLEEATENLAGFLARHPNLDLADVAHTLRVGRHPFEHRRMLVAESVEDAAAALVAREPGRVLSRRQEVASRSVFFLFPGQGAQHPDMGRGLYETEAVFRSAMDACAEILRPRLGRNLPDLLYPSPTESEGAAHELRETRFAQPALFAVEHSLARLWLSWGVAPKAMIGHSLGEYVAACLAGVLSLEDALALVALRGALMQSLPEGAMLSVDLPEHELAPELLPGSGLSLAAVNGPALSVVSGSNEAVRELEERLRRIGAVCRRLHTSHAFHSEMMEPILGPFLDLIRRTELRPPSIPYLSNLTGDWITAAEATSPEYWVRHLRQTVRFGEGVAKLLAGASGTVLLEVGPGRALSELVRQGAQAGSPLAVPSMRHPRDSEPDTAVLLQALGRLWLAGVEVDWQGFSAGERRRRLPLPTYPFQRRRFWVEAVRPQAPAPAAQPGIVVEEIASPGASPVRASAALHRHARPDLEVSYQAPCDETEERLAEVWADLLGIDGIGGHDNFFELGGHSLLATRMISRVREVFGREMPLESLFDAPTVAGFAVLLRERPAVPELVAPPIVPVPRTGELPLSFAQQRLLFLDVLAGGDVAYNLPLGLRLTGPLDFDALGRALGRLVDRHEVLRTAFRIAGGRASQIVSAAAPAEARELPLIDLGSLSAGREQEARRIAVEEASRPLDLFRGPVLRSRLLRLDREEHVILFVIHHIAGDGWSWGILLRELVDLYQALSEGGEASLPELPVQYADFAVWQRGWLDGEVLERQIAYWRQHLAALPVVELPGDRPRPPVRTGRGAVEPVSLPRDLSERLGRLGREEDATLFMVLLSAFCALLRHAVGEDDVVVGTDVANRTRRETEGILGLFVNQVVLRNDLSGDPTFRELLRRVRRTTLEAYAHQDAPFDRLVEVLNPVRDMKRTPLFQIKLVLQNTPFEAQALRRLAVSLFHFHNQTAKFDLLLNLAESQAGIGGTLEFNTDLYEQATIRRLLTNFSEVLSTVASRPDARLREIEGILRDNDRRARERQAEEQREIRNRTIERVRRKAIAVQ